MEQLEHLLLKAATTVATDEGVFEAVISASSVDREKDVVDAAGMVRALHQWIPLGKKIPLAWNHSTRAEDIIGHIDPASAKAVNGEVVASGWIDQSTAVGKEAWRLVKSGTLGFSFGYLVPQGGSTPRKGGGRHIRELDIFEVTATSTPMNGDTRVLGWKAVKAAGTVGPGARHHLENLIRYYMGKPHPFGSCVKDNTKRFGPEGADKVCLAGDTPINTADGEVPIADLRVGDLVWSYNEATGGFELKPVVWHDLTRRDATVVRVTLENGAQVVATPDHPFLRYNGEWADAGSLREGEFLLGPASSGVFSVAGSAEPDALADPALAKANVLGPQVAPSTDRVFAPSSPSILNFLMCSDDLGDLRAPAAGHQRLDYAHHGDGGVTVDLPLVIGLTRAFGLAGGADASEAEDLLKPFERLREHLDRMDLGRVTTAMKGTVSASLVRDLVPTEAALAFEKTRGPSDVRGCQVAEIVLLEEGKDVWDIEVADNHTFVVHGRTVVHNCATLKDIGTGTTRWRHGGNHGKALDTTDTAPSDQDMEGMCQSLYDASGGNLEALLEMWWAHMQDNGDTPKALSPEETVREAGEISREFALRGSRKQADGDGEDEDDPAELLGGMISTAQDFIDDEDDPNDVAVMRQIMVLLLRLQSEEATEPPEDMAPAKALARITQLEEELAGARKKLDDIDTLRRAGEALTLDAVKANRKRGRKDKGPRMPDGAEWVVPIGELEGAKNGSLKAVWTTAYVNGLPDASFLHVEPGEKDSEGKTTPRSKRHFPYKDANGAIDLPHLRNALARIPQSSLPADVKEKLQARAQRILDNQKALIVDPDVAVDVTGKEPSARSVDPLVQQARALALEFQSKGISRRKPPREEKPAPARPKLDEDELRREMRDLMFTALQAR